MAALHQAAAKGANVTYTPADSPDLKLPLLTRAELVQGSPLPAERPSQSVEGQAASNELGKRDLHIDLAKNITKAAGTGHPSGHRAGVVPWNAVLRVKRSGFYEISAEQDGDTWLSVDGKAVVSSPGVHGRSRWATTVKLTAGKNYPLLLQWYAIDGEPTPQIGLQYVTPEINAAVRAARHATVPIVFVGAIDSEGVDRPSLSLPGDADALISAVAAANPRTVVVINTGSAVLMPWLNQVAGVLQAWYPGQEDGRATTAILTGQVDPSGHLPLTFPSPSDPSPLPSAAQWPGVDSTVTYSEGLDIGYRWYQAHHVTPQFPFGFGLSYTAFDVSGGSLRREPSGVVARVTVRDSGQRAGRAVVQAYVHYPAAAGEPPEQLRAFDSVALQPGQSRVVDLTIPTSAFQAFSAAACGR